MDLVFELSFAACYNNKAISYGVLSLTWTVLFEAHAKEPRRLAFRDPTRAERNGREVAKCERREKEIKVEFEKRANGPLYLG